MRTRKPTTSTFGRQHPLGFPLKSLSLWTSLFALSGLATRSQGYRSVAGFAGMLCGLGGAGLIYERVCAREDIRREPVQVAIHASRDDIKSLVAHLVFGAVGAYEIAHRLAPR